MRCARRGARARDTRDTPRWEVPIDQISTLRRVEAPIYTRARPQRPRLFSPVTPWNTPFPARQNTHLRRGLGGPNADGSGADAVLGVPEADTASNTRAVGTTSESGRSVRVGVRVRSSGFAAARIRSFTRIETRAKVSLEWVLPDGGEAHVRTRI